MYLIVVVNFAQSCPQVSLFVAKPAYTFHNNDILQDGYFFLKLTRKGHAIRVNQNMQICYRQT